MSATQPTPNLNRYRDRFRHRNQSSTGDYDYDYESDRELIRPVGRAIWPMALLLALLAIWQIALHSAAAHGMGTPQLLNQPHGPYLLSIWTDPDPLRADETHVVVAVLDPATRSPIVEGVTVTVTLTPHEASAAPVSVKAGTDETNRLLYAAEFNGRVAPGGWRVDVVAAPSGLAAPTGAPAPAEPLTFDVDIAHARGMTWLWPAVGGVGLVVLLLLWLLGGRKRG